MPDDRLCTWRANERDFEALSPRPASGGLIADETTQLMFLERA